MRFDRSGGYLVFFSLSNKLGPYSLDMRNGVIVIGVSIILCIRKSQIVPTEIGETIYTPGMNLCNNNNTSNESAFVFIFES